VARPFARDVAGDDDAVVRIVLAPVIEQAGCGRPIHRRAEFLVAHDEYFAGIEQGVVVGIGAKMRMDQARRPDLAHAADRVADFAGCAAEHADRIEHAREFLEAGGEPVAQVVRLIEQSVCRLQVPVAQRLPLRTPIGAGTGGSGQCEQRVGDAAHGRDDDNLRPFRPFAQQFGDMADAGGVRKRGAAELVCEGGSGIGCGSVTHGTSVEAPQRVEVGLAAASRSRCGAGKLRLLAHGRPHHDGRGGSGRRSHRDGAHGVS
jgi:hypothetical protein